MIKRLTVNAVPVGGAVDGPVGQQLQVSVLEEHLYIPGRARDVAEVGRALRARVGRRRGGAAAQRQRGQQQAQRARAQPHDAPRPWPPRPRRHCTPPPQLPPTPPARQSG